MVSRETRSTGDEPTGETSQALTAGSWKPLA
jgi:hypothetical protein